MNDSRDRRISAVLLDVDGTLIDSNDAHARAWVDVGAEFGYRIAFEDVRWLIGMGGDRVLPKLTGLAEESAEGARLLARRGELFRERYLSALRAFPDAAALLQRLRADGHTLVVATSASAEDLQALLAQAELQLLIEERASSDEADASKPSPDIVQAALARSGCPAEQAVMLGDTPYDVEAAARAGIPCIGLTCGGWPAEALREAVEIYADPAELLRRYQDSLLAP